MNKVLFVCTGNNFRSPCAEEIFRRLVDEARLSTDILVDSAGIGDLHLGQSPDIRAQLAARKRGYDISSYEARQIQRSDFLHFDLILSMDWDNHNMLRQLCPRAYRHKLMLLMRFASDHEAATVPDPNQGDSLNKVLDCLEDACKGVLERVRKGFLSYQLA